MCANCEEIVPLGAPVVPPGAAQALVIDSTAAWLPEW